MSRRFYCTLIHGFGVFVGSLFSGNPKPYRAFAGKFAWCGILHHSHKLPNA